MYDCTDVNPARVCAMHSDETVAMRPDGHAFGIRHPLAARSGNLPGDGGLYGGGNVCLVAGNLTEYRQAHMP